MSENYVVAFATIFSNILSIIFGMKMVNYKIEQLEKKVEKHNALVERVYRLETSEELNTEQHKVMNHRISDLERSFIGE